MPYQFHFLGRALEEMKKMHNPGSAILENPEFVNAMIGFLSFEDGSSMLHVLDAGFFRNTHRQS